MKTANHPSKLCFSVPEAADAIGISERKLRELLIDSTSGIPVLRIGTRVVLPCRALEAWVNDHASRDARGDVMRN